MNKARLAALAAPFALSAAVLAAYAALPPRQPPATLDVQRAYNSAARESGALHVAGLKVLGVKCAPAAGLQFSCQVGFSKPSDDDEDRVYLDVARVAPDGGGWKLIAGLCKRYD